MKSTLDYILKNYINAKTEVFENHNVANHIRNDAVGTLIKDITLDISKYKVQGSPGQGQWAEVPWIGVFDKDITTSAQRGYDIVYLFCADMSGVYVSLNQGWTYFREKYGTKDGHKKIEQVTKVWQSKLSPLFPNLSCAPILLNGSGKSSDLSTGYELGHICGKFYKANNLPNDNVLIDDLRELLLAYKVLKGNLRNNSIEDTNNFFIFNSDIGLIDGVEEDEDELNDIENILSEIDKSSLLIDGESPTKFLNDEDNPKSFKGRKTNYIKKAKNQKKLGYAGELMVLEYEKKFLNKSGNDNLAKEVKHISKEEGDGAGYDILSYELDGTEKYIEVKCTTGGNDQPFYISDTELKFAEKYFDKYYLYRVYDFDKKKLSGKLYKLKGDISKILLLESQQYIVKQILK